MNFLQLVQRLAIECGASGGAPSTTISQTGEVGRLVNWVDSAWQDLQLDRPDWYWSRTDFTLPTVSGDFRYAPGDAGIVSRFSMWDQNSIRVYLNSKNDEEPLAWMTYEDFRSSYILGPQTLGRPMHAAVDPALNLLIGPLPDGVYTVSGEYFKAPQTLALDADIPEMPVQFHMAIVYRALMMYARYENAIEVMGDADRNCKRLMARLSLNQLPGITFGEALA